MGRATEAARKRLHREPSATPVISADYCFLGLADKPEAERNETDSESITVLAMVEALSGHASAAAATRKGPDPYAVNAGSAFLKEIGYPRMVLQTDGEPAVESWADAVQREWPEAGKESRSS